MSVGGWEAVPECGVGWTRLGLVSEVRGGKHQKGDPDWGSCGPAGESERLREGPAPLLAKPEAATHVAVQISASYQMSHVPLGSPSRALGAVM